ncbi:fumarylacetoacetate hydrolase family protein [Acinetobacter larvae]|uniref:Fumarylacetoacetate hydrolase n=1 Tax=Acinetobacter larvae TaxID=1789224 RepID=A0A1B2M333_9GAMM|nr:fumarylacetoacetate hydrolase family protein [Acinetobacter larvae]AOA59433.1 fumarylacetoacetate hydrolase [Acinetobacter larvae]
MTSPSKIICVGRNYADHAKELGNAIPDQAVLFMKPPSSVIDLQRGIQWNPVWGDCHYECELCLRIDRPLSQVIDPEQALAAIGAVTLGLDLTLRDVQDQLKAKGQPWERAKAFDGSCVLADWIAADEIVDWSNVEYDFAVNGVRRQHGLTADMIFDIATLLVEINQVFSLEVGDVIMTGTPAGVGALQRGDQLQMRLKAKSQDFVWNTFVLA